MNKQFIFLAICILIISTSCCTQKRENPLVDLYGSDVTYYYGLSALKEKDNEKAQQFFARCIENGSYYPARRSLEKLASMGNIQDKIKYCSELVQKYNDDDARLFACKEFFRNKEAALVISFTNQIDFMTAPNELCKIRLESLLEKNDSRLKKSLLEWFSLRRISNEHIQFYEEHISLPMRDNATNISDSKEINFIQDNKFDSALNSIIRFRIFVFNKKYKTAYELLEAIQEITIEKKIIPLTFQLVADMGKACLNGSKSFVNNAVLFNTIAEMDFENSKDKTSVDIAYYAWIYAGLLYNNTNYKERAMQRFKNAMECTQNPELYDMALWYLLNARLKISTNAALEALEEYCSTWHDSSYFSDFIDSLLVLLFSNGEWKYFPRLYSILAGNADNATQSKVAYLAARIVDEGYVDVDDKNFVQDTFSHAATLNTGTNVYYKLLAAKELNFSITDVEKIFFAPDKGNDALAKENDHEAEKLLLGYADFGFAEMIYPEWLNFYSKEKYSIGLETTAKLASFLKVLSSNENDYMTKSLRMISRVANLEGYEITKEMFELLYPRNFLDNVSQSAKEFSVDEYVMFGLIRTESFFESKVKSSAGAIGLTQLMEKTAQEVAQKLKVESFDLTDEATNIRFGTFYFSDMVRRLDGSQILALFAYNAGPTRVRQWVKSSKIELNKKNLSSDLFLETLPFAETRDYGRRVISSAAMYAWLYYEKNPCDIVNMMM